MKKRVLSVLLAIVMAVCILPSFAMAVSAAESYSYPASQPTITWTGSGTEADPYVITTAQQLADFAWLINNKKSAYHSNYYKLGNDIDISGGAWEPIGYYDGSNASQYASFKGTFDGNGKTVSGLNSVSTTHKSAALFGSLENGTIKNLTVSGTYSSTATRSAGICARSTGSFYNCTNNVNITISTSSGSAYAGGIAAYCTGNIENCQNNGNLTTDTTVGTYIGGICGSFGASQKQIANCTNTGAIQGNGTNGTGGICATLSSTSAVISKCTNTGNVSSSGSYAGGIIGKANGKIEGCTNSGNVTASTDSAGGICGYNMSSSKSKGGIVNCSNSGTISGPKNIGGISGYGESLISKCNNTGNVKSTNTGSSAQVQVGGIEGCSSNAAINNCYNTGTISGGSSSSWYVGGISGRLGDGSTIENCHSYGTVSNARTGNLNNALYYSGAIFGGSGTVTNSYYLNGTDGKATPKTSTEFSDGSVTRLLQSGNLELVWGQTIGTDTHPVFYNGSNALGVDATGITVNPTTVTVGVGKTVTLTATVTPEHANDKTVIWTSDNNSIATVVNGVVTGVSKGTAIITVTSTAGGFTATCTVTVCDHAGSTHTEYTTANCQHTYTCTLCNLTLTDECTFDAASGICSVCQTYVAVVSVTVNESTTHFKDIISAVEYVRDLSGSDAVEMQLTADSTSEDAITFPAKKVTLDLNGKFATVRSLYYVSGADVTIKDSTSESAGKLLITYSHNIGEDAKLTLNSGLVEGNYQCNFVEGTFVMTGGTLKSTLNAIQVEDANSEIIISGGTLDGGQYAIYRQASYHTSKITLSGGYFINGIRSTSLSGYPLSGLLAEGYKFVDDDSNNVDAAVDYLQKNLRVVIDHKHVWSYTANGAAITATCANTDGACGYPEQSLVIEAPYAGRAGLTFNNTVKAATLSGTIEDVEIPEIVYTLKSTGEAATPFAPGVYVASITLGTATASCEFEIIKATPTYSDFAYTAPADLTYDGTAKIATVVPNASVSDYIGAVEVLYNGSAAPAVNVGSYTVTINVAESDYYKAVTNLSLGGRGGKSFSIAAKDITDLTYDLDDSYPLTGGAATPDVTVTYNGMTLVKDTDYTVEYADNTAVGVATMTLSGIGNYSGTKVLNYNVVEGGQASEITNVSMTVSADLSYNVYASLADADTAAQIRFTVDGKEITVSGEYDEAAGLYKYTLAHIPPQGMLVDIKAELVKDGEVLDTHTGTIRGYLDSLTELYPEDNELKLLVADMLNYGAAAQLYTGYNTDDLANAEVTGGSGFAALDEDKYVASSVKGTEVEGVKFVGVGVRFDYVNKVYFRFTAPSLDGITVTVNGAEAEIGEYGDSYIVYSDAISATELATEFVAVLASGDSTVQTVTYSAESFVYEMQNAEGAAADLARALYSYGLSAIAYAAD